MNKILLTLSMLAITAGSSKAVLIVYEGFDYPQQTGLATQSGGTGWATTWDSSTWRTNSLGYGEISTGLTYSTLTTVGQAARNENNGNQSFRTFTPQGATGLATYWISFLIQKDLASGASSFGISLFNGPGSEQNFLGHANSDNFSVAGQGANNLGPLVTTTPSFFVARYDMTTNFAHFWIDPSLSGTPSDASAFNGSAGTAFTDFTFDRIRLGKFDGNSGYLDEIRIGTAYGDVSPVPEPSTYALLGLGALVALLRMRSAKSLS